MGAFASVLTVLLLFASFVPRGRGREEPYNGCQTEWDDLYKSLSFRINQ
ncbi:hypothetical protein GTCCBUS3UF5_15230 [Geobacillus thermoleovorans CCB_US3_UF5]|uniref:Uncharacterized protein n=1 Tax=Geobacillus thermoleovorans CCB_US3_UF5 TaxID=1111068 RepID=A0ABM5MGS7_GEOTH|nr:hypothetical protein GTCCBUS3UF5_15230 [Geobacillus thermoleovorans CCB_US3_UF5]